MFSINIGTSFDILRKSVLRVNPETDETKEYDPLDHSLYSSKYNTSASATFGYVEKEKIPLIFERIFIFACVWSFGASLIDDSRIAFDRFIKDLMHTNNCKYPFPQKFTCFDYYVDIGRFTWMVWCDGTNQIPVNPTDPLEQQFVPTNESVAPQFLSRLVLTKNQHILLNGPESSKTLLIMNLINSLDNEKFDVREYCTRTPMSLPDPKTPLVLDDGQRYMLTHTAMSQVVNQTGLPANILKRALRDAGILIGTRANVTTYETRITVRTLNNKSLKIPVYKIDKERLYDPTLYM